MTLKRHLQQSYKVFESLIVAVCVWMCTQTACRVLLKARKMKTWEELVLYEEVVQLVVSWRSYWETNWLRFTAWIKIDRRSLMKIILSLLWRCTAAYKRFYPSENFRIDKIHLIPLVKEKWYLGETNTLYLFNLYLISVVETSNLDFSNQLFIKRLEFMLCLEIIYISTVNWLTGRAVAHYMTQN